MFIIMEVRHNKQAVLLRNDLGMPKSLDTHTSLWVINETTQAYAYLLIICINVCNDF